jgi:hypothetical protein
LEICLGAGAVSSPFPHVCIFDCILHKD